MKVISVRKLAQQSPKLKRGIPENQIGNTLSEDHVEVAVVEAVARLKLEKEQPELEEKPLYQLQREKEPKQRISHTNALIKRFLKWA